MAGEKLFPDDRHYERFTDGLRQEVDRSGWIVFAYCWITNHVHALIHTPEPNLARGMQHWLRELGLAFGLTGTDSVSNLVRRAQQQSKRSTSWRKGASEIDVTLHLNTEHKVRPQRSLSNTRSDPSEASQQRFISASSFSGRVSGADAASSSQSSVTIGGFAQVVMHEESLEVT